MESTHGHAAEVGQKQHVEYGSIEVELGNPRVLQVDIEGVVQAIHQFDMKQIRHFISVIENPSQIRLIGLTMIG